MTSVIYAVLSTALIIWLSANVINLRQKHQIALGDGGNAELQAARTAHANAIEYIPIALLMLFALEYNHGHLLLIHGCGIAFMLGRVIHARSILSASLKKRKQGMVLTFLSLMALSALNLIYLPWGQFLP
ncbi:MAPEG family protein [Paraneptunicella aestuarii]|uniref:MAPEG family protein n=1 Tax=Paraneptunicella aestuarii TaxID=2831148 RepID=UPI001E3CF0A5|nr:MAPEG family protein [Paraneptunicella aestuarii]UAA40462.1 MAPEG family protein [Paraneptunicella aestuarii]